MQPLGGIRTAVRSLAWQSHLSQPHRSLQRNMLGRFTLNRGAKPRISRCMDRV